MPLQVVAILALLGVGTWSGLLGWRSAPLRLLGSYWMAFTLVVTVGLGSLFFVLLHHLVGSRWSARACLRMERLSGILRVTPVLFLPVAWQARSLFPRLQPDPTLLTTEPVKALFLSPTFFTARSLSYLALWWGLAHWYRHPEGGSYLALAKKISRMRRLSGPAMILFGLTSILAAFDWWMSLDARFHSAVYGVYVFAGAVVSALALLAITSVWGKVGPDGGSAFELDELHDIAKLLFGFVLFWAYLGFCQYLVIWYAGQPHELEYYELRWGSSWRWLTTLLVMAHFVVPFIVLSSRSVKRSPADLAAAAAIVFLGHVLDVLWLLAPALGASRFGASETAAMALTAMGLVHYTGQAAEVSQLLVARIESHLQRIQSLLRLRLEFPPVSRITLLHPLGQSNLLAARGECWQASWRGALTVGSVITFGLIGGIATSSNFETMAARELQRKANASVERAKSAARIESRDEYGWVDEPAGRIQVPLSVASARVLARCTSEEKALPVAPGRETTERNADVESAP